MGVESVVWNWCFAFFSFLLFYFFRSRDKDCSGLIKILQHPSRTFRSPNHEARRPISRPQSPLSPSLTFEVDNIHAVKSIKPVLTQNIIYIVGWEGKTFVIGWRFFYSFGSLVLSLLLLLNWYFYGQKKVFADWDLKCWKAFLKIYFLFNW